jgi:hypothetical protein
MNTFILSKVAINLPLKSSGFCVEHWWLTPVILATQAEIRRTKVRSQARQIV